jgi:uncharacterized protein (DUF849 family)
MSRPVIISCAVTGGGNTVGKHPAIPVTPEEIATAAIDAGKAGAAIAHIHVRDPETKMGCSNPAYYREVVQRIQDSGSDILINLTTGAGGMVPMKGAAIDSLSGPLPDLMNPADRVSHIEELRPEICSLDMGSMNFGNDLFLNTRHDIAGIAAGIRRAGTIAELEVFDTGHLRMALAMLDKEEIPRRAIFQLCLGVPWGAPATPEAMQMMRNMLPANAIWTAFGIGSAQFPMVAQAILMGGHVRVGLEDNLYIERGVFAPDNAALVEKATDIVAMLGASVATPAEARQLLQAVPNR